MGKGCSSSCAKEQDGGEVQDNLRIDRTSKKHRMVSERIMGSVVNAGSLDASVRTTKLVLSNSNASEIFNNRTAELPAIPADVAWTYLEVIRFELAQVLPDIKQKIYALKDDPENSEELKKTQEQSIQQLQAIKKTVLTYFKLSEQQVEQFVIGWTEKHREHDISALNEMISITIEACLLYPSQQIQNASTSKKKAASNNQQSVVQLLGNIRIDKYAENKMTVEVYKDLLYKFYAALRYQMYVMIQAVWEQKKMNHEDEYIKRHNGDDSIKSQDISIDISKLELEEQDLLKPEDVRKVIQQIDKGTTFKKVMKVYEFDYTASINSVVLMNRLHYEFQMGPEYKKQEELQEYFTCLLLSHDEMLELIQNPVNRFASMQRNPLKQLDKNYGVPDVFKKIFEDLKQQISEVSIKQKEQKPGENPTGKDEKSFLSYYNNNAQETHFKPLYDNVEREGGKNFTLATKKVIQSKVSPFSAMSLGCYSSLSTLREIKSTEVQKIKQRKQQLRDEAKDPDQVDAEVDIDELMSK